MKVAFLDTVHEVLNERLEANGYSCHECYGVTREQILEGELNDYEGIIIRSRLTIDARLLAALSSLKWIARSGSGLDNIDIEEAHARGVQIVNSPEGNRDSGACICNGGHDYCFASSCATCGLIDFHKDTDIKWGHNGMGDCTCGLPSLYSKACFDTNHYGYKIHAPVIDVDHTVAANTCSCCATYTSGTCCGGSCCSAAGSYRRVYGAGGTFTHVMGGGNSNCGDSGRPGMVRVTWWTA